MIGRQVWATLVTNPKYVPGLLTLHRTLFAVSKYPLIVMATKTLPDFSRHIIVQAGLTIVEVGHLTPAPGQHSGFDVAFERFHDTWTKLQAFGLIDYDRVILIDSDMLFLRAMDELFDIEFPDPSWICAAPACVCNPFKIADYPKDWVPANCSISKQGRFATLTSLPIPALDGPRTAHLLNSGLVVLQPSQETMDTIVHFLNTSATIATSRFPDQDVISAVFHGRWQPLPWWANALKTERAVHADVWADTEVRLIHYTLAKPWDELQAPHSKSKATLPPTPVSPGSFPSSSLRSLPAGLLELVEGSPAQTGVREYSTVHAWWWFVFEDMLAEMKQRGPESGWEEVEKYVKR